MFCNRTSWSSVPTSDIWKYRKHEESTHTTMNNSFSLGLLHGALYGITPVTPWFIGLKRYVFEGQTKGLLTFAGLFIGQVILLLIAFFGGTELLWLWYYLEPVFIMCGLVTMIRAFMLCWRPSEIGKPLINRKEGLLYLGTGAFFALCNPGGMKFGGFLLNALPDNTELYLCGFLLVYTLIVTAMVYILCLSPFGQKCFGPWSLRRMLENQEPSATFYPSRVRNVRIMGIATFIAIGIQCTEGSFGPFSTFYADLMLGSTPAQGITPMRDFYWIESDELETLEEGDEKEPAKVWKRQSQFDMNHIMDNESEPNLEEESPWHTIWKYNALNEKLEREDISDEQKKAELDYYERKGPNTYAAKKLVHWYESSKLRLRFNPELEWDKKDEMNAYWLKELTRVRAEMDDIFVAQHEANFNLPRPHLPFNPSYDIDYDWDPVSIAKDEEMTEEDALTLLALQRSSIIKESNFLQETYDMVHRGSEQVDFGVVKLQDLPKEVHLPWDYPLVHAPNVPDITPGIQEEDETVVNTKNAIQNKNVWFLDPIAVNMRFFANDPAPATDPRWTSEAITPGEPTPGDVPELRAVNTTRRWWLGTDVAVEEDAQTVTQTPREIISAKVIAGGAKRP